MLKTVVIEDEQNLLNMLLYFLNNNEHYEVVGSFTHPQVALQQIPTLKPDVIFLDIEMPHMNGIELASILGPDEHQLIFTTAYEQYALDALKLEASEYLLKPITPESIQAITPKILKKQQMLLSLQKPATIVEKEWTIQCFGSFTATTPDERVIKWPTRKVEELFAYLLVHSGCVINKWRLAEDLWPDKGLHNIYNSVYLLNKTLKQYEFPITVANMNEGYKLQIASKVSIDLVAFNELHLEQTEIAQKLKLANFISQRGQLFQDKDYAWATLYREQNTLRHQKLLNHLLQHFVEEDEIVYEGILKDYETLYSV